MSILAFTTMVFKIVRYANWLPYPLSYSRHLGSISHVAKKLPLSGVAYWYRECSSQGISEEVARCTLKSITRDTLVGYQKSWRQFSSWCGEREIGGGSLSVNSVCTYLIHLFNSGTSSGVLNSVRSALSFFTQNSSLNLGNDPIVARCFKSFYKSRPTFPRYMVTWDVGQVLRFLAQWHPPEDLSLKQLTLKTVALIALTSSDRRGHGRCTVFGYIFKFSWPPFSIEGLYVGSMIWTIIIDLSLFSRFAGRKTKILQEIWFLYFLIFISKLESCQQA